MKNFIKSTLEGVLNTITGENGLISQGIPADAWLEKKEIDDVYLKVADALGDKNAMLIGGGALQRYCTHKPKDIDLLVCDNFCDYIPKLKENGFSEVYEEKFKPFFKSNIYASSYELNGKKIGIEFYSSNGILGKKYKFNDAIEMAKADEYLGKKIYYADPYTIIVSKYESWKNRLFNGRADKDLIDLKEANFDNIRCDINDKLQKAYKGNFLSEYKSFWSYVFGALHRKFVSYHS